MKKYLIIMSICFAIGIGLNINLKTTEQEMIGISLDQIEALAYTENNGGIKCMLLGSLDCPISTIKVKYY